MRTVKTFVFVIAAFFSTVALAQGKIAVVDLGSAIFSTDVAQERQNELQSESDYASLQARFDSITADMKALQEEAEAERMTWSQDQAQDFRERMEGLQADRELVGKRLQRQIRSLQNEVAEELQPKAQEALQEIIEQEGISVLLRAEAVLMAEPAMDITPKLVDRLNEMTQ